MMRSESRHYERAELWDRERTERSESARLAEMTDHVPPETTSVLDAGGGNGLFLEELRRVRPDLKSTVCLDRSLSALAVAAGSRARGELDKPPFRDGAFDCVTCLEVLEHLPVDAYAGALREIARVARQSIVIAVPFEQDLEGMLVTCVVCRARFNPYFHLRSFSEQALRRLLGHEGWSCVELAEQGVHREPLGATWLASYFARKPWSVSPFDWSIECPICGASMPPLARSGAAVRASGSRRTLRSRVRRIWPTVRKAARVVAIYRRVRVPGEQADTTMVRESSWDRTCREERREGRG
ncbi:hypothetical protein PLCT1_01354 [Planctomycetaceae bacterium]|nr:hypothetical protein PLCT1_01354 [Planctomycetaceae bacterium]